LCGDAIGPEEGADLAFFDRIAGGRYNNEIVKGWFGRIDRILVFLGEMIHQFNIAIATSNEAYSVFRSASRTKHWPLKTETGCSPSQRTAG
jgi:hypothetical protein